MVQGLLEAVGPELASKLGRPVYSNTVVAEVSEYMQERWGALELPANLRED